MFLYRIVFITLIHSRVYSCDDVTQCFQGSTKKLEGTCDVVKATFRFLEAAAVTQWKNARDLLC